MEQANRRHFFKHGPGSSTGLDDEKRDCHWCQIRGMPLQRTLPVTIVNTQDDAVLPGDFEFIEGFLLREGVEPAEDSFRSGCDCGADGKDCQFDSCTCLGEVDYDYGGAEGGPEEEEEEGGMCDGSDRKETFAYCSRGERKGMLKSKVLRSTRAIYECHSACSCSKRCPNRTVERGRTVPLQIFRTEDRGWGVRSTVPIKRGQFVDCYIGEALTAKQANERRQATDFDRRKDVYLFTLDKFYDLNSHDERLHAPLEVDGEFMSGPTRFVNHSCDPNMRIFARVGDHADKHLHDLAMFAIRDIPRGEELTFDYVDGVVEESGEAGEYMVCLCGSQNCRGYLF